MTIRHLKIFLAVCESNFNTTKAADRMHMTQPAVSLAVRELEQYYGVALFDRIGRRLQITEGGQKLREYSLHIVSMFNDMEKSLRNWDSFGLLRVGASITIGSQFLPGYVKAFSALCPDTKVRAIVCPSKQLEQKILNNELDFALIEGICHFPEFICEEYMEDELTVICPPAGGFCHGQEISASEFRQQNFLLREEGSGTREVFDRAVAQAGFSVTPIWEATSTAALVNAVANGLGIAVLPHRMVADALKQGQVLAIRVKGLDFQRKFHIIYHNKKFLTSSAKTFLALCRGEKACPNKSGIPDAGCGLSE